MDRTTGEAHPEFRIPPTLHNVSIRLLALAMLAALAWPLPAMIGFQNPDEGIVFGRYTLSYAVMLAGYSLFAAAWAALAVAILVWLRPARLEALRDFGARHIRPLSILWLAIGLGMGAVRALHLDARLVFAGDVNTMMRWVPGAFTFGLAGLTLLIGDTRHLSALDAWLGQITARPARWLDSHPRLRGLPVIPVITGLVIALGLGMVALRPETWQYPLTFDPSMHVYVGQSILRGAVPYYDVIVPYPPLRLAISLLWSLGSHFTGIPVVPFARALNFAAAVCLLAITYSAASYIGGRRLGGLLAIILLLSFEVLQEQLIDGPTLRMTTLLLALLGLWLAQRERWLWAGVALSAGALTYAPVAALLASVGLAALLQKAGSRWKNLLHLLLGTAGVLAVVVAGLLAFGLFDRAFALAVQSPANYVTGKIGATVANTGGGLRARIRLYRKTARWALRGDWEAILVIPVGIGLLLATQRKKNLWQEPESATYLIASSVLLGLTLLDFQGSAEDLSLPLACLIVPGAAGVAWHFSDPGERPARARISARQLLGGALAALLLAIGSGDAREQQQLLYDFAHLTLAQQQEMAQQLAGALEPGQEVAVLGNMWPLVFADLENASPYRMLHYRNSVFAALNTSQGEVLAQLEARHPALLMISPSSDGLLSNVEWLQSDYIFEGYLPSAYDGFEAGIYVRKGQAALEEAALGWPLLDVPSPR